MGPCCRERCSNAVQWVQQLCLAAQAALSHGLVPVTLWQEALAPHRCHAALLHKQQSHSRQHAKQQLLATACHLLRQVRSAATVSNILRRSPACMQRARCPDILFPDCDAAN